MLNYNNAKPSLFIEEELPSFVKGEGQPFINFLQTYYDWLEKKVVMLNLKAPNEIDNNDLNLDQTLFSFGDYIILEESTANNTLFLADESQEDTEIFDNKYSLYFNGANNFIETSNTILSNSSNFSLGIWFNPEEYPSILNHDIDIISISDINNIVLLKVSAIDNKIYFKNGETEYNTDISISKNKWYFCVIRYTASTKRLRFDVFDEINDGVSKPQKSFNISNIGSLNANYFSVGYNKFSHALEGNYFKGKIDNISIWSNLLTDSEVIQIYNEGTPLNILTNTGNYVSSGTLTNLWSFETANNIVAVNSLNNNNLVLYNSPLYVYDTPLNLSIFKTEFEDTLNLNLKVLSYINYDGIVDGENATRMLLFAEHIKGKLADDITILTTANNVISIDSFSEAKNPLNGVNNLPNYQDIDYTLKYDNFVTGDFFQFMWKEIMANFPLYLSTVHERSIKNIIGKTIIDFYRSKGTEESFKYLFKILYNEDVVVESNTPFQITVKTKKYASSETKKLVKSLVQPLGFKLKLKSPYET